jgi:hypothetical protein
VYKYQNISSNNCQITEFVDLFSFKESIKNKIFFYNETTEENELIEYKDKCLFCEKFLSNEKDESIEESQDEENLFFSQQSKLLLPKVEKKELLTSCTFCKSTFHLQCVAKDAINNQPFLIPKEATCIICLRDNSWSEFVKNIN